MYSKAKFSKRVIILLSFCFLIRIAFFFAVKPWNPDYITKKLIYSDASEYHAIAKDILRYRSLEPINTYRTPLYPLFVAFFYRLFGEKPCSVLIFQIFLNIFSCFLLMVAVRKFLGERIAIATGLFYGLDPFLTLYCSILCSEILFVFLCVVSFYYIAVFLREQKMRFLFFSSFFIGLAALTRPISQFLPVPIVILLFFLFCGRCIVSAIKNLAIYLFVFLITISPWLIRNYVNFGTVSLSAAASKSFLELYVAPIIMVKEKVNLSTASLIAINEVNKLMRKDNIDNPEKENNFKRSKYYWKVGIPYLKKEPVLAAKFYILGIAHSLGNLGTYHYCGMLGLKTSQFNIKEYTNLVNLCKDFVIKRNFCEHLIGSIIAFFLLISYSLATLGLWIGWRSYSKPFLTLCILMAIYFVLITGSAGYARYKIPSIPFYTIFIGIGFCYAVERSEQVLSQKFSFEKFDNSALKNFAKISSCDKSLDE